MAYSLQMISNTQPAIWLSLLAFYVYFQWRPERFNRVPRLTAAFVLLMFAMQSTQTFAFFCMVPLSYLTLCDWKNQRRKIVEFLALAAAVFVLSGLAYKAGLHYWHASGQHGYHLGEDDVAAIGAHPFAVLRHALNPFDYWSAFEVWSYPYPFHSIPPLGNLKYTLARCVLIVWALVVVGALLTEIRVCPRQEKQQTILKWLTALACLAFGAVFMVADSPLVSKEHRPHIAMTFAGVAIFAAAYSLRTLAEKYRWLNARFAQGFAIFIVAMIAFGAQADLTRGYVNKRVEQLDYVRTELSGKDPTASRNIIVVLPQWNDCTAEPCGPWAGQPVHGPYHVNQPGGYRYALATLGIAPDSKTITFVSQRPDVIQDDEIVIDWQRYASVHYRRAHLH
jgi:hypothetical protein